MYYVGYSDGQFKLGLAKSSDGINWIKSSNNPILSPIGAGWERKHIYRACPLQNAFREIILVDGKMRLYYSAYAKYPSIGLATISPKKFLNGF